MITTHPLTLKLPYPLRHLLPEIKNRGGRFNPENKIWPLPDNPGNRALAGQLAVPTPTRAEAPEDRLRNVATVAVELLNQLKLGHFTLCETTVDRVVLEKIPTA